MTEQIIRDSKGLAWLQSNRDGVVRSFYIGRVSDGSLEQFIDRQRATGRRMAKHVNHIDNSHSQK